MGSQITKDTNKIAIRINPKRGANRTLTTIKDYNAGTQKDTFELGDPSIDGSVPMRKWLNPSRDDIMISVQTGSSDEAFLDKLADESIAFDLVIIDEMSSEYKKEYTGQECTIKDPGSAVGDFYKEYTIVSRDFSRKRT